MISFSMPEWCMIYPFQYFSIRPLGAINIKQGMDFIPYALGSSFLCGVALGQKNKLPQYWGSLFFINRMIRPIISYGYRSGS